MSSLQYSSLLLLLLSSLASCQSKTQKPAPSQSTVPEDTIVQEYRTTPEATAQEEHKVPEKSEEIFPPEEFVLDLKNKAPVVVKVEISRVDSVNQSIKVFHSTVLKSYKGRVANRKKISFAAMADTRFPHDQRDTLIVFLERYKKPLSKFPAHHVLFGAIEENALLQFTPQIELVLTR